jgi:hypothetical protein
MIPALRFTLLLTYILMVVGCGNGDPYAPLIGSGKLGPGARKALLDIDFLSEEEKKSFLMSDAIPIEKLTLLQQHEVKEIRHLVAWNPSVSEDILFTLSSDTVVGVRGAVATSANSSEKILSISITDASAYVKRKAVKNANWSSASLSRMLALGIEPHSIAKNPSASIETLTSLVNRNNEHLSAAVASNQSLTIALAERLRVMNSPLINRYLCANTAVGDGILKQLTKSHLQYVVDCANKTILASSNLTDR